MRNNNASYPITKQKQNNRKTENVGKNWCFLAVLWLNSPATFFNVILNKFLFDMISFKAWFDS